MDTEQLQIDRLRLLAEIDKTTAPDRISLLQAIEFLESLREDIAIRLEALDTRESSTGTCTSCNGLGYHPPGTFDQNQETPLPCGRCNGTGTGPLPSSEASSQVRCAILTDKQRRKLAAIYEERVLGY